MTAMKMYFNRSISSGGREAIVRVSVRATAATPLNAPRLLGNRKQRSRYTLGELLACSDYSQSRTREDREWITPPVGRELL